MERRALPDELVVLDTAEGERVRVVAIARGRLDGQTMSDVFRQRVLDIRQSPDGLIYLVTDEKDGRECTS